MCVHDTDARGYCVKNGHHCAFAHGLHDQRPAVYDIKEIESSSQAVETNGDLINVPNALDKERNLMNEDPKWQDTNHVLTNYKTEPCKRPPRLCRQGYACPQYHNSKDKRRSPRKFSYRCDIQFSIRCGNLLLICRFVYTDEFSDQHRVRMWNMAKNGVSLLIVKLVITVNIVTLERNSNFIRKSINRQNVMTFNRLVIVPVAFSAPLHMLNVSFLSLMFFVLHSYKCKLLWYKIRLWTLPKCWKFVLHSISDSIQMGRRMFYRTARINQYFLLVKFETPTTVFIRNIVRTMSWSFETSFFLVCVPTNGRVKIFQ